MPQIIDVVFIIVIFVALYGILGTQFLETDLPTTAESDFKSYYGATKSIFFLTSLANYPGIAKPFVEESVFFAFYFLPFVIMTVLVFLSIPVAVVFDRFRTNRTKILLED